MSIESVSKLVPEMYYDLITRIVPGTALVLCLDPLRDVLLSYSGKIGQVSTFLVLLGAGYLAGLILSALALPINLIIWYLLPTKYVCKLVGATLDLPSSPLKAYATCYKLIDYMKKTDAVAGGVLTKTEAIATLADHLLCGVFVLAFAQKLNLTSVLIPKKLLAPCFICLLVIVIIRRGVLFARLSGFLILNKTNSVN